MTSWGWVGLESVGESGRSKQDVSNELLSLISRAASLRSLTVRSKQGVLRMPLLSAYRKRAEHTRSETSPPPKIITTSFPSPVSVSLLLSLIPPYPPLSTSLPHSTCPSDPILSLALVVLPPAAPSRLILLKASSTPTRPRPPLDVMLRPSGTGGGLCMPRLRSAALMDRPNPVGGEYVEEERDAYAERGSKEERMRGGEGRRGDGDDMEVEVEVEDEREGGLSLE